jgi:threonine dehydrogenase-like Zn-dependent dehydrogenase
MAAHPHQVRKIPDTMLNEEAALAEPVAVGYSAVKYRKIVPGDTCMVTGGGIIGSVVAQWCKYFGAGLVLMTEAIPGRAQMNTGYGYVDKVYDALDPDLYGKLMKATNGKPFDHTLECSGNVNALNLCISVTKREGEINLVGIIVKPAPVH